MLFEGDLSSEHPQHEGLDWAVTSSEPEKSTHFSQTGEIRTANGDFRQSISINNSLYNGLFYRTIRFHRHRHFKIDKTALYNAFRIQKDPVTFDAFIEFEHKKIKNIRIESTDGYIHPATKRKLKKALLASKWTKSLDTLRLSFDYGEFVTAMNFSCFQPMDSLDINEASLDMITMSVTQMGWINCDRFYKDRGKKPVYVQANSRSSVLMIFDNINAIIPSYKTDNQGFYFGKIPKSESYTLLSYYNTTNGVKVAERSHDSSEPFSYQTMSREEFVKLLSKY